MAGCDGGLHGERLMAFRVLEPVVERIVAKLEENRGHLEERWGAWGGGGGPLEKDHLAGIFSFKEDVQCGIKVTTLSIAQPPVMPRVPWTLVDLDGTWLMELIDGSILVLALIGMGFKIHSSQLN